MANSSFISDVISGVTGQVTGDILGSNIIPASPSAVKKRPSPSGFEQTPLPTAKRTSGTSSNVTVSTVAEQGDNDDGASIVGTGYSQDYKYDYEVTPITGGPKYNEIYRDAVEPDFGVSYLQFVANEHFAGKTSYNRVTGQFKQGMPAAFSGVMGAAGLPTFLTGAGGAISQKNLESIARNAYVGKDGYAVAELNGRTIGLSPGIFGGTTVLSGVLPNELTALQRRQITEQLQEISKTPEASGAYSEMQATPINEAPHPGLARTNYDSTLNDTSGSETPQGGGTSFSDPTSDSWSPSGRDWAVGGKVDTVSTKDKKGPAQNTGFIDGPPQNYSKGMTVADTEDMKVRVGSFVINAPTTERLQKEGKLPKGPQKRKAAKGGKMMDVALSKGEYLIDVADIEKFGGYDALNAENDKGKAEVERRQAAASGGFINGYQYGGSTGIKAGPLSTVELMKSGLNLTNPTPSSFMEFDSGDLAPYTVNGINVGNVQKALTLVETRGYQDRNEGYFFTRADTSGKESSAFGPLQITKKTLEGMVSDNFGELELAFKTEPGFKEYYNKMIVEGRNAVNVKKYKDIYVGPEGSARPTYASEEEKAKYKGLGYGNISVDEHKKYYPTLASVYMNYKAGMSKSEEDLVVKHFGNKKSLKKYQDAKKELGIK